MADRFTTGQGPGTAPHWILSVSGNIAKASCGRLRERTRPPAVLTRAGFWRAYSLALLDAL